MFWTFKESQRTSQSPSEHLFIYVQKSVRSTINETEPFEPHPEFQNLVHQNLQDTIDSQTLLQLLDIYQALDK